MAKIFIDSEFFSLIKTVSKTHSDTHLILFLNKIEALIGKNIIFLQENIYLIKKVILHNFENKIIFKIFAILHNFFDDEFKIKIYGKFLQEIHALKNEEFYKKIISFFQAEPVEFFMEKYTGLVKIRLFLILYAKNKRNALLRNMITEFIENIKLVEDDETFASHIFFSRKMKLDLYKKIKSYKITSEKIAIIKWDFYNEKAIFDESFYVDSGYLPDKYIIKYKDRLDPYQLNIKTKVILDLFSPGPMLLIQYINRGGEPFTIDFSVYDYKDLNEQCNFKMFNRFLKHSQCKNEYFLSGLPFKHMVKRAAYLHIKIPDSYAEHNLLTCKKYLTYALKVFSKEFFAKNLKYFKFNSKILLKYSQFISKEIFMQKKSRHKLISVLGGQFYIFMQKNILKYYHPSYESVDEFYTAILYYKYIHNIKTAIDYSRVNIYQVYRYYRHSGFARYINKYDRTVLCKIIGELKIYNSIEYSDDYYYYNKEFYKHCRREKYDEETGKYLHFLKEVVDDKIILYLIHTILNIDTEKITNDQLTGEDRKKLCKNIRFYEKLFFTGGEKSCNIKKIEEYFEDELPAEKLCKKFNHKNIFYAIYMNIKDMKLYIADVPKNLRLQNIFFSKFIYRSAVDVNNLSLRTISENIFTVEEIAADRNRYMLYENSLAVIAKERAAEILNNFGFCNKEETAATFEVLMSSFSKSWGADLYFKILLESVFRLHNLNLLFFIEKSINENFTGGKYFDWQAYLESVVQMRRMREWKLFAFLFPSLYAVRNEPVDGADIIREDCSQYINNIKSVLYQSASDYKIVSTYTYNEDTFKFYISVPSNLKITPSFTTDLKIQSERKYSIYINQLLKRTRKFSDVLNLCKINYDNFFSGMKSCTICYMVISLEQCAVPTVVCHSCLNSFHRECIGSMMVVGKSDRCPLCRRDITL